MKKPRFLRAVYFIWLAVPVAAYVAVAIYGLPHVLTSTHGRTYAGHKQRIHSRCNYSGPYGRFEVHFPRDGACAFIRFFKLRGAR
ncbi:hypothetical protein [Stappia sp. ES.058]|uniref:hypothetical protein n=1 Tax=Stappia sp. ES.058 TaxID=1881061 RepID=UPI00087CF6D0|nr:hypothetical protein [Stappia sp. ES.058]SDU42430.1 hypothetical protein SAMN05428979_3694 [Stappia sp. ES.058]